MVKVPYPTDLTDQQWQVIEKIVDGQARKRKHSLRSILDAIFYVVKTGCQWRMLPSDYAPRNTVYYYYRKWKFTGLIEELHEMLRSFIRKKAGRNESPSLGLIDSRSVKTSRNGGLERGIDGGKKTKGRKQHIITDTMGLVLTVVIHAANVHDSKAALGVIRTLKGRFPRLCKIIADGGYQGELAGLVKNAFGWILEVVLRPKETKKFVVLPKRWIVERTFSWFEGYRRL
ncbi:MAG: IS5 family transposase, partial [Bacteroidales bacterium]|nr:IS5 family transposase [Bacteroidales bacterium]